MRRSARRRKVQTMAQAIPGAPVTPLRPLPHNLEAERSVLGAILVENNALNKAQELLRENDFYRDAHRRIFRSMGALSERATSIDLVTLHECLIKGPLSQPFLNLGPGSDNALSRWRAAQRSGDTGEASCLQHA